MRRILGLCMPFVLAAAWLWSLAPPFAAGRAAAGTAPSKRRSDEGPLGMKEEGRP